MADIFDVIADATRRELLQHLLDAALAADASSGELSVGELVERMDATQPTVSKHLKVLREHGLVTVREEGQHRYYRVDASPLEEVEDYLVPFLSAGADGLEPVTSPVFTAWAGADVERAGSTVGRVAAGASHQARTVVHEAQERLHGVQERLHGVQESVTQKLPWKRGES
ncbi:MAG: metalloregulator ArsR/SmtB family transcription factor [Microcella pacifica]|jgi:DNA-binding transcriptional ArsR family regulator|uniref:ArsR/SmtB family transcription factor n=1 Tax=Microcella pacifica TaxID=2591847 RepID=UPI000C567D34|nr:transcriptional regulator [Leifsonia sp.]